MIELNVEEFATEAMYDKLKVFDGKDKEKYDENLIKKLDGARDPDTIPPITSSKNAIFLQFTSDDSGDRKGFLIRYSTKKGKK